MAEKMQVKSLGFKCRFCGSDVNENDKGWGCSNYRGGCKAFIWKDDRFFQKIFGRKPRKAEVVKLLKGEAVEVKNVVLKGKKGLVILTWGAKEGSYPFGYDFKFYENNL